MNKDYGCSFPDEGYLCRNSFEKILPIGFDEYEVFAGERLKAQTHAAATDHVTQDTQSLQFLFLRRQWLSFSIEAKEDFYPRWDPYKMFIFYTTPKDGIICLLPRLHLNPNPKGY